MRTLLTAIVALTCASAFAASAEDFKACLIGYSAVALDNGAATASAAMNEAAAHCPLPDDPNDEIDVDAIADHALLMVERMAAE